MNPSIAIKTTNLVFYSPTISPPHVGWYKQLKLLKGAPHHHTDPPLQTVGPFIKTRDTFLLQVEVEQMSELCPLFHLRMYILQFTLRYIRCED